MPRWRLGRFDKDVTQRWLEDMPFADHNAILDPTCSDLTARTLELLGLHRISIPTRRCVRRAIQYLRKTQEDDGSWYGRWGVNYIYGTWQVLRGLRAIGEDMRRIGFCADAIGWRAVRTKMAAGAKHARRTKIRRAKAKVKVPLANGVGR